MSLLIVRLITCSLLLFPLTGLFLLIKQIFRKQLPAQIHYVLWLAYGIFLFLPFLPAALTEKLPHISLPQLLRQTAEESSSAASILPSFTDSAVRQSKDLAVSVERFQESSWDAVLFTVWISGMIIMLLLTLRSCLSLRQMKRSAIFLEDPGFLRLVSQCREELHIKRPVSVFITPALKSPACVGILKPAIYLPLRLLSDFSEEEIRFMLLHELRHCRQNDNLINLLVQIAAVLYWFHPMVWVARNEIRCDREVSCDCAVMNLLRKEDRLKYGHTLICFAEKISLFSFAAGFGSPMKQMKRRISNIAGYQPAGRLKKAFGGGMLFLTVSLAVLMGSALPAYADSDDIYRFSASEKSVSYVDLSSEFGNMDGCFVVYDRKNDHWQIYQEKLAQERISPASTYKIYDALLALESGTITPDSNKMTWDGTSYPFSEWEQDQTLDSAVRDSVNWYFQKLDASIGRSNIQNFLNEIDYGNQRIGNSLETYWLDQSLKISAVEQVELLIRFEQNQFQFKEKNIQAVKDSLLLSSDSGRSLYGKTGTIRTNEGDSSGWFIGYSKTPDNTFYFAVSVRGEQASGAAAQKIAGKILF